MLEPLELSDDFQFTLSQMEQQKNLFVTGRAGTGKSTLLKLFKSTTKKKSVVVAPTGIAALNVGGQTIHSFFRFPGKILQPQELTKVRNRRVYQKLEMLIIDEISMVRADLLDNIDYFLRINRDNNVPFGGVQVVFFGDLFQLPPVVSSREEYQYFQENYESPYFFSANVLKDPDFEIEMIELNKTYRQESRHFIRLLDAVRTNQLDYDDMDDLNERYDPEFEGADFYITLSARNAEVDSINRLKLLSLQDEEFTYLASVTGNFQERLFPTELALKLKLGAQVMFVKNDPKRRFVNGTIGKVVDLDNYKIKVAIEGKTGNEVIIDVEKVDWEIQKYRVIQTEKDDKIETSVVGTFSQYPLKLAWAITIHKSQGKTFDKVIIELGKGAFEHGQTYVALSRCRTLEGIVLKMQLRPRDIMVDERIVEFYEQHF